MEYQEGQKVRIKYLDYDQTSGARYHYVTRQMARVSGKVGKVMYREKYDDIIRYKVLVDDELIYWFEDAWLMPAMIDNRSI